MANKIIVAYPYPWANERLLHKDVYNFPHAIAKALNCECRFILGKIITGSERDGQCQFALKAALFANTALMILRLFFGKSVRESDQVLFILFHISLPSALIAYALRLRFSSNVEILVKADLGDAHVEAALYRHSFFRRKIFLDFSNKVDVITVETSSAFARLRENLPKARVILCPNGFDAHTEIETVKVHRSTDVLILSRFNVSVKGADQYAVVIPLLLQAGLQVEIIGSNAKEFIDDLTLPNTENLLVCDSLPHSEVLLRMRTAKVFLSLSYSESFLIALIEAYAMGCHVVTTQVGVAEDLAALTDSVHIIPHDPDVAYRTVLSCVALPNHKVDLNTYAWDNLISECGILDALK